MRKFDFAGFNMLNWPILLAILILLVILVIIVVAKMASANRRKTELLAQINDSVSELNQKVGQNSKVSEAATETVEAVKPTAEHLNVVFIDNRVEGCIYEEQKIHPAEAVRSFVTVAANVSRFTDRNCGTDKNGRSYTEEELRAQIKE